MRSKNPPFSTPAVTGHANLLRLVGCFVVFLSATLVLLACGDGDDADAASCTTSQDCSARQICISGQCVSRDCTSDEECGGGTCDEGQCRPHTTASPDTSGAPGTSSTQDATPTTSRSEPPHPTSDSTDDPPPTRVDPSECIAGDPDAGFCVLAFSPERGSNDTPLDFEMRVTFNEAIAFSSVSGGGNLSLRDIFGASGSPAIEPTVDPDDPRTLVISITEPERIRHGTYYRMRLERFIRSEVGNLLDTDIDWVFRTTLPTGREPIAELADAYAPVFFQEVGNPRWDTFTRVDFDSDFDARNNLANADSATLPANVYYTAATTETHWFINYFLYYPGRLLDENGTVGIHDTSGVLVVVTRDDDDPLGQFVMAASYNHPSSDRTYRLPDSELPEGLSISNNRGDRDIVLSREELEDGRRIQLYVTPGNHNLCLATTSLPQGSGVSSCGGHTGSEAPFSEGSNGRIFRAGEAEVPGSDEFRDDHTYGLLSFDDELWIRRDMNDDTRGHLFSNLSRYQAPSDRPPERVDDLPDMLHPRSFATESGATTGQPDLPFNFDTRVVPQGGERGIWIMDPAFYFINALNIDGDFPIDYCFHLHQEIDHRGDDERPCAFPDISSFASNDTSEEAPGSSNNGEFDDD